MKTTKKALCLLLGVTMLALGLVGCQPEVHVHTFSASKKSGTTDEWELKCTCGEIKKDSSFHAVFLETLGTYTDLGSGKYTFGVYPQTIKASSVTVDKDMKNTEITGAAYYLGSDGAWYAECVENGCRTGSDSENSQFQYSDGSYVSKKNAESPKLLYFKVEPIEWTKLSVTGCLVAAKSLTAGLEFYSSDDPEGRCRIRDIGGAEVDHNNYQHSRVRAFLNGLSYVMEHFDSGTMFSNSDFKGKGFLQSAFTKEQQEKIKTTAVDNSLASTGYSSNEYTCDDTSDKVFLLSYKEAFTDNGLNDSQRIRDPTDYALANSCFC